MKTTTIISEYYKISLWILTSSFKLLTNRTVAIDNPEACSPLKPGAVCAKGKLLSPGTPATPPAKGEPNGEFRL